MKRWLLGAIPLILVRPWLWRTALRFVVWPPWRALPFVRFRHQTAYGQGRGDPRDVIAFLYWARRF